MTISVPLGTCARKDNVTTAEIVGAGFHYPSDVVTNDDFFARARYHVTDDPEALVRDSRMRVRRWCKEGENTWTMAEKAIDMALAHGNVDPSEIDVVIVSSCSTIPMVNYPNPDNPVMADLAPMVLRKLGRDHAFGLDLKATYCAGFLRAMEVADGLLKNPNYRKALIVATDQGGRGATAETNHSPFCFIVGDSAGAVVLEKRKREWGDGIVDYVGGTVPSQGDLTAWGPDGKSMIVMPRAGSIALEYLIEAGKRLMSRNGVTAEQIDWLLPAQTHAQAIDALAGALGFPKEKVLWTGDETGYAASASIATALGANIQRGVIEKGDLVMSMAVGAGLNWAGALYFA